MMRYEICDDCICLGSEHSLLRLAYASLKTFTYENEITRPINVVSARANTLNYAYFLLRI